MWSHTASNHTIEPSMGAIQHGRRPMNTSALYASRRNTSAPQPTKSRIHLSSTREFRQSTIPQSTNSTISLIGVGTPGSVTMSSAPLSKKLLTGCHERGGVKGHSMQAATKGGVKDHSMQSADFSSRTQASQDHSMRVIGPGQSQSLVPLLTMFTTYCSIIAAYWVQVQIAIYIISGYVLHKQFTTYAQITTQNL